MTWPAKMTHPGKWVCRALAVLACGREAIAAARDDAAKQNEELIQIRCANRVNTGFVRRIIPYGWTDAEHSGGGALDGLTGRSGMRYWWMHPRNVSRR